MNFFLYLSKTVKRRISISPEDMTSLEGVGTSNTSNPLLSSPPLPITAPKPSCEAILSSFLIYWFESIT